MRLFIAINLSPQIKGELLNAQNAMVDHGVRGNYTPEDNMHLTLAFIGDYPDPQAVLDALSDVDFTPFDISLDGIGSFGDLWWAGIKESVPLTSVARRVRRALAEHGIPFDRKRFSPHITLLRKATNSMPGIQVRPIGMTVGEIALMRSDRGRSGMIYTELGVNCTMQ
ncbi:MAG: RNA 2',3'-cyclic phosphodiesterase [Oscillospiraceae bacterium]|nr:RNA 2',3'-cyclic phosphodiesterase [Oscillospiraceae bacterium]